MADKTLTTIKWNYCHYIIKQALGFLIQPKIALKPESELRIADFGTSTALWPIDLAETLPTAKIDGFDTCADLFPPDAWKPKNITLRIQDVFEPFPDEFHEKYDLIQLRWFLTLTKAQLDKVVKNIMSLLKPGGYVQWIENDHQASQALASSPDLKMDAVHHFIEMQRKPFTYFEENWIENISPAMTRAGLNKVAYNRIALKDSLRSFYNQVQLISMMEVPPGLSENLDEFRDVYLDKLKEEYACGISTTQVFTCIVAQKPL